MFLLEGGSVPKHSTFARFKRLHFAPCAEKILAQTSNFLYEIEEISGDAIFIDGTKIEASSNKYTFVWKRAVTKNMAKLLVKIADLVKECEELYDIKVLNMNVLVFNKINEHENEINEIKNALKHTKSVRLYKRYSVLLKHFDGFNNRKIAEMENIDEHTVAAYIKNYKSKGLNIAHGGGASKKINEEQEKIIVKTITTKTPQDVGFESKKNWTIELVKQWVIKEFNITMSHRGIAYVTSKDYC